jgi:hypothetical protein
MGTKTSHRGALPAGVPITGPLALAYASSLVVALMMTVASVAGLLYPTVFYPTDELLRSFVATDVVNLLIGVPGLLGSMWLARRGKLIGLLFWPGALFYVLYHYVAYLFSMSLNVLFLPYLALVALSAYTMIGLVANIDGQAVRRRLAGVVRERVAGGVLIALGGAFLSLVIGTIGAALANGTPVAPTELAVHVADFVISPAWVIGGVLLWRRRPLGYVSGAALLFQASTLFVGVIGFLLLQPLLTDAPFALDDVIVLSIMSLVCLVPFGLFVRGILSQGSGPHE